MELKNKKYNLIDTAVLCFKINRLAVCGVLLLTIMGALIPPALVIMNSAFIDAALTYAKERSNFSEVIVGVTKISLTLAILYFHTIGVQLLYDRLDLDLKSKFYDKFIKRCVDLKYEYIENGETCNLIDRVLNKPGLTTIHQSFIHLVGVLSVAVYLLGLTVAIWKLSWWIVPWLVIVSTPLILSTNLMSKEVYNSVRWNSELARKSNYIEFDMLASKWSTKSLTNKGSAVFQNFGKYKLTLRENVMLSDINKEAEDAEIRNRMKESGFDYQREGISNQLGTMLCKEFNGIDLSGGEWQRLAIARGIYRTNDMIVLDEPTAAIDPIEEANVYRRFDEISKGKTVLTVTHRLGSVKTADRIIVLKEGEIIEDGSHAELMHQNGFYPTMFLSQAKWYQRKGEGSISSI